VKRNPRSFDALLDELERHYRCARRNRKASANELVVRNLQDLFTCGYAAQAIAYADARAAEKSRRRSARRARGEA
jgi:hypothetical protein